MENQNGFRFVLFQTKSHYAALAGLKSGTGPPLSRLLPGWQTCVYEHSLDIAVCCKKV